MDKILIIEGDLIKIVLPKENSTQYQILEIAKREFTQEFEESLRKKDIKIYGKLPSGLAIFLGFKLKRICKSVSAFDPREGIYIKIFQKKGGENK